MPPKLSYEWELPHLREAHQVPNLAARVGSDSDSNGSDLWSVKFYPFTPPGAVPVFAVVGNEYVLICRPPAEGSKSIEVISSFNDDDEDSNNFVCAWTKDLETGAPLLCMAGNRGAIKIINILTGELYRTLTGHGGEIEDLQTSPVNLQILASACDDSTVRIWSLDPAHAKQPCVAILAGDGHRETILSLSFHANGRYLLSAGIDRIINLWVLPEFPDKNTGTNKPTQIYYPHFSTSEIHSSIVDCVWFYNDLILSKADNEQRITLWMINGFSSTNPPPDPSTAPTVHDGQSDTRSAFTNSSEPWTRLLHFSIPDPDSTMFTRFALFPGTAEKSPVLAFCSGQSKLFFWDLARLEAYHDFMAALKNAEKAEEDGGAPPGASSANEEQRLKRPSFLIPFRHRVRGGAAMSAISRVRESSPTSSTTSSQPSSSHHPSHHSHPASSSTATFSHASKAAPATHPSSFTAPNEKPLSAKDMEKSKENWARRYDIGNAWTDLAPHKEEVVKALEFTGRQVAWSPGGEWCVVVGSAGALAVFERWGKS